ncbi:putative swi/snf-related matrix-associated actin-dependent regulator of chromatin subfamily a member 3-like 1 [Phtheirospermum japonicum]|uniref:Putative swi/snf-related matrix-associated actin-dependent regulator of chromatin subfamily a member 3-like 1 n=1 Tax=Phtheirospermum japonicum TaxID=374723 RepID=A0A830BZJ6_9LAMI|nr:putative swi/snf-related matrix-associated actin-dependent regulator of chromatin subfamily a member 3-like 1 [Phtheirospermum japonicum]
MAEIEPGSENRQDPVEMFMSLDCWPSSPADDGSSSPGENLLVGFVIANVVGLRYYDGRISGRELVGLVRDDLNPHDGNAIKVLNMRSVQVGFIERSAAAVLSPLIDGRLITVEGIVPKPPGKGSRFKLPCQIHIFARAEELTRVKVQIAIGGLQLISEINASFTLSESMAVKEKNGIVAEKSVDEIFKLLDLKVSNEGVSESIEPPKDMIKSELFPHQKEGLGWLVSRESSNELPPFWEEKNGVYVNELTNYQTDTRPEPLRGGIFADDMGLGKTLTLLSLISLDKAHAVNSSVYVVDDDDDDNNEEEENIVFLGKAPKRGRGSKKTVNSSAKKRKTEDINNAKKKGKSPVFEKTSSLEPKTTLIVCPPSVFSAWMTQLEEHTKKGVFKVYMYYGERTKDAKELQKHDIVLTTYSTLASEESWDKSPIKGMEWRRVILDEAHVIKNVNTQQSRAVTKLNAKCRWAVTGTPVQNSSFDLFSLVAFLKFEPLSMKSLWHSLIQRPLAQGDEKGVSRLQVLMAAISLRRTKDKALVGLPSKSIETFNVTLREEERRVYDQMEEEARNIVKVYISNESVVRNYSTVLSILVRLRQICIDLALCPADLRALLPQNGEDFDCPICISPPTDIVITCCAHIFCESCIIKTLKRTKPNCPMCRHPLSESDLFKAPPEPSQTPGGKNSSSSVSSKVDALLKLLTSSRDVKPSSKSVIFSQFRKMLLLLEEPLKEAGFNVIRLDGSMNAKKRAQVIREFNVPAPEGPTILLASLKASNAGINLTAASTVYLLEPWWNPAVEEQAMDRVHRIGQVDDVRIVRLIARNTIEERILQLQENKRALARKAFGRKGQKDQREISRDDLSALMNL